MFEIKAYLDFDYGDIRMNLNIILTVHVQILNSVIVDNLK